MTRATTPRGGCTADRRSFVAAMATGMLMFGRPAAENARAVVFLLRAASSTITHRHEGDAVEVVFDGPQPTVTFVPSGTSHSGTAISASGRMYIFELK